MKKAFLSVLVVLAALAYVGTNGLGSESWVVSTGLGSESGVV